METNTTSLHSTDAQSALHEIVHTLKQTGFWSVPKAKREVVIPITENENVTIEPKDGDHIIVIVDKNIESTIEERTTDAQTHIDIILHENAKITYGFNNGGRAHVTRFAHIAENAVLHWSGYAEGSNARSTTTTYLAGKGADAKFSGCFLGTDEQQYTMSSTMIHAGDKSTSNMLTRSALMGASKGSADGLIRILPHARGCDAYQRGEALLLSKDARMHAEPNLEIANPEVKCSHGVSLSRIDDEKLFYFRARGIGTGEAITLIVQGFFAQIIDRLPHGQEELRSRIAQRIGA